MAEFTYIELRKARESRKVQRWKLAAHVGTSEDTVRRWEIGDSQPTPDDIDKIEDALGIPGLWHKWMISNCDSYRKRYASIPDVGHKAAAVIRAKLEVNDLLPYFPELEIDAIDGSFDDSQLKMKFRADVLEAVAALQKVLDEMVD